MKYLTLAADYSQSPLRDDYAGPLDPTAAGLRADLSVRLNDWNDRYRAIIPLSIEERSLGCIAELITQLDEEGSALSEEIRAAFSEAKVRYYSEGLLRYLS
jgi:hypothetical protein